MHNILINSFLLGFCGHWIRIIHDSDVVNPIFSLNKHIPDAFTKYHSYFISKSRIISFDVWICQCINMTLPIAMLQSFSGKRSSAGNTSNQKASGACICCCPCKIAYTLKTKHRVEEKDRNNVDTKISM